MSFLARLGLLFVLVPLLELILLVRLGDVIGLWPTLGLVVFTGVTGAALARAEGLRVLFQFQRELAQGRLPGQALQDAIAVLVGGAFLLTPGVLTDLAGFALLLPPTRRWIQKWVRRGLQARLTSGAIQVVSMGPGAFGGFGGFGGGAGTAGPGAGGADARPGGLDPTKEIRVEPKDPV
jgi:UPF0716 protein FxsA